MSFILFFMLAGSFGFFVGSIIMIIFLLFKKTFLGLPKILISSMK
jgi:hypothetical protein